MKTAITNNYLRLTGGTMTGEITNNSSTASTFNYLNLSHPSTGRVSHIPFGNNKIYLRADTIFDNDTLSLGSRVLDFLIYLYGSDYGFGINGNVLRYNCPSSATHKFYSGTTNTTTIGTTGLAASPFYGDGANITNVPYSSITGKPTNFQADWNSTITNKPLTFPVDTSIYYNQTQVNGLKQIQVIIQLMLRMLLKLLLIQKIQF